MLDHLIFSVADFETSKAFYLAALEPLGYEPVLNAAKAVGLVLPELKGKLDGFAMRVPTINVSFVDLTFTAGRDTTVEEINSIMQKAADGNVLVYNDKPLVSVDFNHTSSSSNFDAGMTRVMAGNLVKACSWYDNEGGFSCRMLDTTVAAMNA